MDDRQQRARELLQKSEHHFSLAVQHQAEGARLYREYRELMRAEWEGYTIGAGDG